MQAISGIVEQVSSKPWVDNKTGENIFLYSFKVGGNWYRTGRIQPTVGNGQAVKFVTNGQNVDVNSLEVVDATQVQNAAPPPAPAASAAPRTQRKSGGENWEARQQYWENKEKRDVEVVEPRITYSAAQRDAISLISAALANGAVSFGQAKAAAKFDMLLDMVDDTAKRFFDQRISGEFTSPTFDDDIPHQAATEEDGYAG